MQRGQAFETIMMVIAVIVALAILGFLTGILGNLGTMFNPSNPIQTMTSALAGIQGSYSDGVQPQSIAFPQSMVNTGIDTNELTQSTQLSSNQVGFLCCGFTGTTAPLTVKSLSSGASMLTITQKVTLEMTACGNPNASKPPQYYIALGPYQDSKDILTGCASMVTSGSAGSTCSQCPSS